MGSNGGSVSIVVLDLETTGLEEDDEIIQIAACTRKSRFNVYITPTKPVSPKVSEITGLEVRRSSYLYLKGVMLYTKSAVEAFKDFLEYLRGLHEPIIIVAHNGFEIAMPKMIKLAEQVGYLVEFEALVRGFSDSLIIFRNVLLERRQLGNRYPMQVLVEDISGDTSGLHNCANEVLMLLQFLEITEISDEHIVQQAITIKHYLDFEALNRLLEYERLFPAWMRDLF